MEEVTKKNPKRVEARKKAYKARMLKFKEEILAGTTNTNNPNNVPSNTSNHTTNVPSNSSNPTTNVPSNVPSNNAAATKSTNVYMYSVGSLVILAVGLCVFFYNFKSGKPYQAVQQAEDKQQTKKIRPTL